MTSVCFYFQVHQPLRIGRYSHFDSRDWHSYFDNQKNAELMKKVSEKCYLPMNELLLRLIERHNGDFKVSFSITGIAIEQMELFAPEALYSFQELARTGHVEFLGETYYHSLSSLYSEQDFKAEVREHSALIRAVFGQTPTVFRNTELIYDNRIGHLAEQLGFKAVLAEGVDDILKGRSPNYLYKALGQDTRLLLKNYQLSDDIAFRFSNRDWKEWPVTAEKYAAWAHQIEGKGDVLNLFMDYETFGEHQWRSTGIFDFMWHLPQQILSREGWSFRTPSEVIDQLEPKEELHYHRLTSWADAERDLSAWRGNKMQQKALSEVFELRNLVHDLNDEELLDTWQKLLTSDHFYYMSTKGFSDGDVHAYFSPFESPYDAFVNYMNVLKDFKKHLLARAAVREAEDIRAASVDKAPITTT